MGTILGIDPGVSGALVWLVDGQPLDIELMPSVTRVGLDLGAMRDLLLRHTTTLVVLERAQPRPGQGAGAMFTYSRDYGAILGLLAGLQLVHETVPPATWHRALCGARVKGETREQAKARALRVVRERLPTLAVVQPRCRVPHDGVVDAACLALWGGR